MDSCTETHESIRKPVLESPLLATGKRRREEVEASPRQARVQQAAPVIKKIAPAVLADLAVPEDFANIAHSVAAIFPVDSAHSVAAIVPADHGDPVAGGIAAPFDDESDFMAFLESACETQPMPLLQPRRQSSWQRKSSAVAAQDPVRRASAASYASDPSCACAASSRDPTAAAAAVEGGSAEGVEGFVEGGKAEAYDEDDCGDLDSFFEHCAGQALADAAALEARRAVLAVVPTRLEAKNTVSIPPLPHHEQFFVRGAPRWMKKVAPQPLPGDVDVFPDPLPPAECLTPQQFYDRFVCATSEQCLAERGAPQGSAAWLQARSMPITASQFGSAIGECPYEDSQPTNVVHDKLWNTFRGNEATRWGSAHEDHAQEAFEAWFPVWLRQKFTDAGKTPEETAAALASVRYFHDNLMRFASEPWIGVSPDGFVEWLDTDGALKLALCEWKCAFTARGSETREHPYKKWKDARFADNVPSYYGCQVLGVSGYLNSHLGEPGAIPRAITLVFFGVWSPLRFYVTMMEHSQALYTAWLHPALKKFYFGKLLPALAHKHNRVLRYDAQAMRGSIQPPSRILD